MYAVVHAIPVRNRARSGYYSQSTCVSSKTDILLAAFINRFVITRPCSRWHKYLQTKTWWTNRFDYDNIIIVLLAHVRLALRYLVIVLSMVPRKMGTNDMFLSFRWKKKRFMCSITYLTPITFLKLSIEIGFRIIF